MKWTFIASLALAAVSPTVASDDADAAPSNANKCTLACTKLAGLLKGRVALPDSPNYTLGDFKYWSVQQSSQRPACRVIPDSAEDVSVALKVLKAKDCQFAVKSGGHASFAGASNIGGGGVAIDLGNLNKLTVACDRKTVSVGPGMLWSQVYKRLDPVKLSVIGGRSGDIGVGGLTLGGGISFFSGRYGWACDNVRNYQVVLADGSIREVNEKSYPDLFFALRGGGNNFGIVTRFDLVSFEQGDMWGGETVYTTDHLPALNQAFYDFNINHPQDPFGAVILAYVYVPAAGYFINSLDLEYGKPIANPPILANFTNIPSVQTTARITNMTDLARELNATQPAGKRETFWTFTVYNNLEILADIQQLFTSMIPAIADAPGLLPALIFQPISTAMTSHFSSNGGNALGIDAKDGPLTLINISFAWTDIEDDTRIMKFAADFISGGVKIAKDRKVDHPYIYQNYASAGQEVFKGYGKASHARLRKIHDKYDPTGVFTKLQPGYFKI